MLVMATRNDVGVQFDYLIPSIGKTYSTFHIIDSIIIFIDCLSNVHIAGEKLFQIQEDVSQLINWKEYGLKISIQKGTVSETADVAILALVGGQFVFPKNTQLVSAVYSISVSKPLLKPLRLEMQHCVHIQSSAHTKYLKFAVASVDQSNLPYEFIPVDGGKFVPGEWYGSIERKKLSPICILYECDYEVDEDSQHEQQNGTSDEETDQDGGTSSEEDNSQGRSTDQQQEGSTNQQQEGSTNQQQEVSTDQQQERLTDQQQEGSTDQQQEVSTDQQQEGSTDQQADEQASNILPKMVKST